MSAPTAVPPRSSPAAARDAVPRALAEARQLDDAGRHADALAAYTAAVAAAATAGDAGLACRTLYLLGRAYARGHQPAEATDALRRSLQVAESAALGEAAGEALNGLGILAIERGDLAEASDALARARDCAAEAPALRARVEQNLGIVANIRGDLATALAHYECSRQAFEVDGDERGCALAYHNLGMLSADQQEWHAAEELFQRSLAIATRLDDAGLRGLCLMNQTEVLVALQRFAEAKQHVDAALRIFDRLGNVAAKSGAYRMLGVVYRDTGRPALAEARLRTAIELAVEADSALHEAEASRHLALLFQALGRNQDALRLLNRAHRLYRRLGARTELRQVSGRVVELERTFRDVVRDWGQSIESVDSYTHGHCERVARYAVRVAVELGLGDVDLTTIRLGAYLHDVGKLRVPHEILNKPGKLTAEEFATMQRHPEWGLELLAAIEFPWDIKPIIRWHHEKVDGSGYPDRLADDEIPLAAQIICIADVYDALTSTRSYRPALTHTEALAEMRRTVHWWRDDVFRAFVTTVGLDTVDMDAVGTD